jgi:hypothetical protein
LGCLNRWLLGCEGGGLEGGLATLEDGGGAKDEDDEARRDMARTLKDLKQRHPDKDMEQLVEMANYQVHTPVYIVPGTHTCV